jgi:hypothetical protein
MDFDFAKFGTFGAKTTSTVSAKVNPKTSFVSAVNQQIVALLDNAEATKGDWFKVAADGSVKIILKSGIRVLPMVDDSNQMVTPDKENAVKYLQAVAKAAETGEFDKYFARAAELSKLALTNKTPAKAAKKVLSAADIEQRLAASK